VTYAKQIFGTQLNAALTKGTVPRKRGSPKVKESQLKKGGGWLPQVYLASLVLIKLLKWYFDEYIPTYYIYVWFRLLVLVGLYVGGL
jgi:hypothetical protein